MDEAKLRTLAQLQEFLDATTEVNFTVGAGDAGRLKWAPDHPLGGSWRANRRAPVPLAKHYRASVAPFTRKYIAIDASLLVPMDCANEDVCGPTIAHLLRRALRCKRPRPIC